MDEMERALEEAGHGARLAVVAAGFAGRAVVFFTLPAEETSLKVMETSSPVRVA